MAFKDDNLFGILMSVLEYTEIHQDASNRYYVISKDNALKVVFLVTSDSWDLPRDLSVYTVLPETEDSYKLSLSKEVRQSFLRSLDARVRNKSVKKLSESDFDKILSEIKKKYTGSDKKNMESIETHFAHSLREVFKDIPGKEKYINRMFVSRLLAQHLYAKNNNIETEPGKIR